jgi:P-type conjugative transfer protein TrbG
MMRWVTASAAGNHRHWMRSMERCGIVCVVVLAGVFARDATGQTILPVPQGRTGAEAPSCDSSIGRGHDRWDTLRDTIGETRPMACDTTGRLPVRGALGTIGGGRTLTDPVVAAAREYARTGVARTGEQGAFETFPYGHAQPTVTCAPLRACVIELEAGESVLSKIAGDTQRWEIQLATAGTNGQTPLVVVKPHDCGLTTNLVLATTTGRIYDLTLDSPPCPHSGLNPHGAYVRHVRFYYPDALVESWAAPQATPAPILPATTNLSALNFAYRIAPERHVAWVPIAVFDDGAHCYIKLPSSASHREAPALFALADDGSRVLLNYSLMGDSYVTDRVFRSAVLVVGEGGHERTVRLENLRYDAGISADTPISGDAAVTPQRRVR